MTHRVQIGRTGPQAQGPKSLGLGGESSLDNLFTSGSADSIIPRFAGGGPPGRLTERSHVYLSDFGPDEFRARRQKMCEAIGNDDAWVLLQGAGDSNASGPFRQYNEFYYLCGVEVPHAYLLVNTADEKTTLFLPHEAQVGKEAEGEVLSADNPEYVCQVTGVDQTLPIEALAKCVHRAGTVYIPLDGGQGRGVTPGTLRSWGHNAMSDPWDGARTRVKNFIETVRSRFPHMEIRDLSPIIVELRLIKSPGEIALMRRAGKLTAAGVREAIRSTRPGAFEYQLDAVMCYHFLAGGAGGRGYHTIAASGVNVWHGHYKANNCELTDGEWVLCDGAPDYHYYTSDIGRMWPVNGTYSPEQRQMYGFVVEYHKALLQGIRPGRTLAEINAEAAEIMAGVLDGWHFDSPAHAEAARAMFEFRGHLSHSVGMCVHDGSGHYHRPLEPGIVFSVDPQMRVGEEQLYIRCEDTVVLTEDGIENLTVDAPLELDDVEALMRENGLLQAFAPV